MVIQTIRNLSQYLIQKHPENLSTISSTEIRWSFCGELSILNLFVLSDPHLLMLTPVNGNNVIKSAYT